GAGAGAAAAHRGGAEGGAGPARDHRARAVRAVHGGLAGRSAVVAVVRAPPATQGHTGRGDPVARQVRAGTHALFGEFCRGTGLSPVISAIICNSACCWAFGRLIVDVMLDVRIRAAMDGDLVALVNALGQEPYFRAQLARQRDKHGELLVAWHGETPIGDVYLWLEEAEEPEVRERLPGVPLLTHLEVAREHRNRRIGTRLMLAAERRLRELGHDRVALGVDLR